MEPNFCWLPTDLIKRNFEKITQWAKMPATTHLFKRYKTPHPFNNYYHYRRNEDIASDTLYSHTKAIDCGVEYAQLFYGTKTQVTDVYGMKQHKHFVKTLQDVVRKRGAMNRLLVDSATVECSEKVLDFLRQLVIQIWQLEPKQQHQNPAEQRWQTVKQVTNRLLAYTGADSDCWLLGMQYVSFVFNHCATQSLNFQVPLQALTGQVSDISPILAFAWWEPVYYKVDDSSFPSDTVEEKRRQFVCGCCGKRWAYNDVFNTYR